MKAPPEVLQKYPSPLTAVKVAVFGVVIQSTVPVLPKPTAVPLLVIVAPDAIVIDPPH